MNVGSRRRNGQTTWNLEETVLMEEKITLCGDDCFSCPRYTAKTDQELEHAAELWYRVGWRDKIVPAEEMRCKGCSSHKNCTYHLVECIKEHNVQKCSQCSDFPCIKISDMLQKSDKYQKTAKAVCSKDEYMQLEAAFFTKRENLMK